MQFKPQAAKFEVLRSKTDRQLLALFLNELEGDTYHAYRAYATAVLLLPTMKLLGEGERRMLERRLEALRLRLNGTLAHGAGG